MILRQLGRNEMKGTEIREEKRSIEKKKDGDG